ncbi:hypothetical protein EH244_19385 [Variovorax beijingensis]|uniref:Uncharacterized protein n=1 Tax=Variovorax beijingensis TaxID=2496117 RepID=A0A3P3EK53_9BURK|nr:hypothetical protein [Variovorax beijingensis]RRH86773.1 hypothetical protein EH244_19385 [Variovorax beijingensis]
MDSALQVADVKRLAMLFAKLRWLPGLGSWLFESGLLDAVASLAVIAAAVKILLFLDSGAVSFWLLLCFGP